MYILTLFVIYPSKMNINIISNLILIYIPYIEKESKLLFYIINQLQLLFYITKNIYYHFKLLHIHLHTYIFQNIFSSNNVEFF